MVSTTAADINLRRYLLDLDPPIVGGAYQLLIAKTAPTVQRYRVVAWQTLPIARDEDIPGSAFDIDYDNQTERELCLHLMQDELKLFNILHRRSMRRRLDAASKRIVGDSSTPEIRKDSPPTI
jgi:hypothetical protein